MARDESIRPCAKGQQCVQCKHAAHKRGHVLYWLPDLEL